MVAAPVVNAPLAADATQVMRPAVTAAPAHGAAARAAFLPLAALGAVAPRGRRRARALLDAKRGNERGRARPRRASAADGAHRPFDRHDARRPRRTSSADHDSADDERSDNNRAARRQRRQRRQRTDDDTARRRRRPRRRSTTARADDDRAAATAAAANDQHDPDDDRHDAAHDDHRAVRALYFGTYDRDHPRNVNAIAALRAAGVDVDRAQRPCAGRASAARSASSLAETRLLAPRRARFRRRDRRLPGALRRAARPPRRGQAAARLRRRALARGRADRRAATVSAALGGGDRAARRRRARPHGFPTSSSAAPRPRRATSRRSERTQRSRSSSAATRSSSARRGRRRIRSRALHLGDASTDIVRDGGAARTTCPCGSRCAARSRATISGSPSRMRAWCSASFRESRAIPAAVFDALATGAPVVTADTAAARELLHDGESALLVPPNDPARSRRRSSGSRATTSCARASRRGREVFAERASRRVLGRRWPALARREPLPEGGPARSSSRRRRRPSSTGGGGGRRRRRRSAARRAASWAPVVVCVGVVGAWWSSACGDVDAS